MRNEEPGRQAGGAVELERPRPKNLRCSRQVAETAGRYMAETGRQAGIRQAAQVQTIQAGSSNAETAQ